MIESFEQGMKIFRENLAGMYDNGHMTKWADVDTSVDLDRLQRAHEREIVEALCDACDQCDCMDKKAHEHEMDYIRKAEYSRGYEDGRRSMDAEHAAVALRLRALPLDGDTTENLSQIAKAVWHSDFGWTQGACSALRDELVRLMGGVSERPYPTSTFDVLGNERYKAVCRLLEVNADAGGFVRALASAIGVKWQAPRITQTLAEVRDRLIYLLGGAYKSPMEYISDIVDEYERTHGKIGIELDGAGLSRKSVEAMSRRANLSESVESAKSDAEDGGEIGRITDELREYISATWDGGIYQYEIPKALRSIADRIDAEFDRICEQQEAVLQSTIDGMVDEYDTNKLHRMLKRMLGETKCIHDELQAQSEKHRARDEELSSLRDECRMYRTMLNDAAKSYDGLRRLMRETQRDNDGTVSRLFDENYELFEECEMYRSMLNDAAEEYKMLDQMLVETSANFYAMCNRVGGLQAERDGLQAKLDRVRDAMRDVERGMASAWEAAESVRGSSN